MKILEEGVHSGDAGGVVPSSFRIARQLLDRVDDSRTGVLKPAPSHGEIPADRLEQAKQAAAILGDATWKRFPWASSCCDDRATASIFAEAATKDPVGIVLNRTWRAALAVTGADGLPPTNGPSISRELASFALAGVLVAAIAVSIMQTGLSVFSRTMELSTRSL